MSKGIRSLYLYVVSLIMLILAVTSLVGVVSNLVGYYNPVIYYDQYYYDNYYDREFPPTSEDGTGSDKVTADYISNYKKHISKQEKIEKRERLKSLVNSLTLFVISTPLYIFHFKKTRELNKDGE